jgi:hypothetical protein
MRECDAFASVPASYLEIALLEDRMKRLKCTTLTAATVMGSCLLLVASPASAAVVYREVFGNGSNPVANQPHDSVGWHLYHGTNGAQVGESTANSQGAVSAAAGRPHNLGNIGQAQAETSQSIGLLFSAVPTATPTPVSQSFWTTSEYNGSTPLNTSTLDSISFYQGSSVATSFRVALEFAKAGGGTQWYVSPAITGFIVGSVNDFDTDAKQLSLSNFTGSDWSLLNFTPNTTLSVGTVGLSLPGTNVLGFGAYALQGSLGTARMDTYEINAIAVPEPASVGLLASLGAGLLLRRRRLA